MKLALDVVAALLAADLIGVLLLFGAVALIGRRERRFSAAVLLGPMLFLAFGMALVYGALWLCAKHWGGT